MTAYDTGARRAKIADLQFVDIDKSMMRIHIREGKGEQVAGMLRQVAIRRQRSRPVRGSSERLRLRVSSEKKARAHVGRN